MKNMKCSACNYEYETDWVNGKKFIKKGYKGKFIEVKISAHNFTIDGEDYCDEDTEIYACPNCGTIRLDDYDLRRVIDQREWKRERENS